MREHIEDLVGSSIDKQQAHRLLETLQTRKLISARERLLIAVALHNIDEIDELPQVRREVVQAELLKNLLQNIIVEED